MMAHLVVLITAGSADEAAAIARALVEERLAACANIVPGVRSIYRWENAIHDDPEVLLVVETRADCFAALERRVQALHSYDVPEIVALPLVAGSTRYLAWLDESVQSPALGYQPGDEDQCAKPAMKNTFSSHKPPTGGLL